MAAMAIAIHNFSQVLLRELSVVDADCHEQCIEILIRDWRAIPSGPKCLQERADFLLRVRRDKRVKGGFLVLVAEFDCFQQVLRLNDMCSCNSPAEIAELLAAL